MSDFRVALVAEGATDTVLIEAALKAVLDRPFTLTLLQPEPIRPEVGGWGGVVRWCHAFADRGHDRIEDDPTLPEFDLFILHLDADVAGLKYEDINQYMKSLAVEREWPPLPASVACPPPDTDVETVRGLLLAWTGIKAIGDKTVFCVPSKAIEAWLAAAVLDNGHALLQGLECNLNLDARLAALPLKDRIKKTVREYRKHEQTITTKWAAVKQRCTQAERFSNEVIVLRVMSL